MMAYGISMHCPFLVPFSMKRRSIDILDQITKKIRSKCPASSFALHKNAEIFWFRKMLIRIDGEVECRPGYRKFTELF